MNDRPFKGTEVIFFLLDHLAHLIALGFHLQGIGATVMVLVTAPSSSFTSTRTAELASIRMLFC